MAEIEEKEETIEKGSPKKWTDEDVAEKVKNRLKNLHLENEALKQRMEAMEQDHSKLMSGAPNPDPNAGMAPMQAPMQEQPNFQEMLNEHREQIKQDMQQQHQEAQVMSARQKIQKMMDEDKEFSALARNENGKANSVPEEVAVHLATQFDPKVAKNILKELLTNETFHMRMENSLLKGQEEYSKWLNQLMNSKNADQFQQEEVPDLSGEAGEAAPDSGTDNIDAYINNL